METSNIVDLARREELTDALTDLLRTGAQQLIATAKGSRTGRPHSCWISTKSSQTL